MAGVDSALDVVVLGSDGFRLRAATEDDGEFVDARRDHSILGGGLFALRNPGTVEGTTPDQGAGSADGRPPDRAGVVHGGVALPRGWRATSGPGRRPVP